MPATGLKLLNKGLKKHEKIHLEEHLANNEVNWHQVCNMVRYRRDVFERQSLSEVKMGGGSPIEMHRFQFLGSVTSLPILADSDFISKNYN